MIDKDLQKKLDKKYNFKKEELQLIMESIPANVFFKDTQGRYQLVSHICSMLSGGSEDFTIIGKTDYEIMPDKALGQRYLEEDIEVAASGKELRYIQEMDFSGEKFYFEISKRPVRDLEGKIIGLTGFVNDVTEMIKMQKQLEQYSVTDKMTGVYNRSYYEQMEQTVQEEKLPMAVIIADCNKLKAMNDLYGHKQGDYFIMSTVSNIKRHLREEDLLIRMGGDEFMILCPQCDETACKELICEIKKREKEIVVKHVPLSTSYGYAVITKTTEKLEDAMEQADQMMYQDKTGYVRKNA